MSLPTLCVGADVHLDEIVLCAVDKAESHEVCERFRVTNNLPGAQAAATAIAAIAESLATPASRSAGKRPGCYGFPSTAT